MTASAPRTAAIDDLMERASRALVATDYFEAERLCVRAVERALRARDHDRLSRACLPLQEARRQRRHAATDAGFRAFVAHLPEPGVPVDAGCYVLQPPLVGIDARAFRALAAARRVPTFVLVKEPTTSAGLWPIVGVGSGDWQPIVVRIRVQPPADPDAPDVPWLLRTQEALGDTALSLVDPRWPADHRVEDLLEYLDAVPDHEKLIQALEATARDAAVLPPSKTPRRRGRDDPFSF